MYQVGLNPSSIRLDKEYNSSVETGAVQANSNCKGERMRARKALQCGLAFVLLPLVTAISAAAPTLTFKFKKANVPGAEQTLLDGVNNAGMTVGEFVDTAGGLHGFILNAAGTKFTQLDDPKAV